MIVNEKFLDYVNEKIIDNIKGYGKYYQLINESEITKDIINMIDLDNCDFMRKGLTWITLSYLNNRK